MNKKHKIIYIAIISLVAVIVGILLFIWLFIFDGINPLSSTVKYETLISQRNDYASQYEDEESTYKHLKTDLDAADEYKDRVVASEILILQSAKLIDIQEKIVEVDDQLLNLNLNDELQKKVLDISLNDTESLRTLEKYNDFLISQDIILRYYLELHSIENCFNTVDFDSETKNILSSLTTCHTFITNLDYIVTSVSDELPKTVKYIKTLDEYWSLNIELYSEINSGRTNRLDELNDSIKSKKKVLNSSAVESEAEINIWLANQYAELE